MTTFDERERGFERKFAHDSEMLFRAQSRRNRLLGQWAAGKMGITGDDAVKAYAQEVVRADFKEAGDNDVLRKISGDFREKGVTVSDAEIRQQMDRLLAEAKAQLMDDAGS